MHWCHDETMAIIGVIAQVQHHGGWWLYELLNRMHRRWEQAGQRLFPYMELMNWMERRGVCCERHGNKYGRGLKIWQKKQQS